MKYKNNTYGIIVFMAAGIIVFSTNTAFSYSYDAASHQRFNQVRLRYAQQKKFNTLLGYRPMLLNYNARKADDLFRFNPPAWFTRFIGRAFSREEGMNHITASLIDAFSKKDKNEGNKKEKTEETVPITMALASDSTASLIAPLEEVGAGTQQAAPIILEAVPETIIHATTSIAPTQTLITIDPGTYIASVDTAVATTTIITGEPIQATPLSSINIMSAPLAYVQSNLQPPLSFDVNTTTPEIAHVETMMPIIGGGSGAGGGGGLTEETSTVSSVLALESFGVVQGTSLGTVAVEDTGSIPSALPLVAITKGLVLSRAEGSLGAAVEQLQSFLIASNIDTPATRALIKVGSTGYFGLITQKALQDFQKKAGLPSTGIFGPLTRAYIEKTAKGI